MAAPRRSGGESQGGARGDQRRREERERREERGRDEAKVAGGSVGVLKKITGG